MSYYEECCEKGTNCLHKTIKDIIDAQVKVAEESDCGCCTTGCECSINDLLAPSTTNNTRNTTIPFLLYCKASCSPFFATGIYKETINNTNFYHQVQTPIFKAKKFKNNSKNCVQLELLIPAQTDGSAIDIEDTEARNIAQYFTRGVTNNFIETGLCITIDLNHFFAITCLDPIRPIRSSNFP